MEVVSTFMDIEKVDQSLEKKNIWFDFEFLTWL